VLQGIIPQVNLQAIIAKVILCAKHCWRVDKQVAAYCPNSNPAVAASATAAAATATVGTARRAPTWEQSPNGLVLG